MAKSRLTLGGAASSSCFDPAWQEFETEGRGRTEEKGLEDLCCTAISIAAATRWTNSVELEADRQPINTRRMAWRRGESQDGVSRHANLAPGRNDALVHRTNSFRGLRRRTAVRGKVVDCVVAPLRREAVPGPVFFRWA